MLYYKQGGCFALKKFIINGGKTLSGTIHVSGAKNSAVALLPAAILCDEVVNIYNVPNISDTYALIDILKLLNVQTEYKNDEIMIDPRNLENRLIDEELCSKLRGSYYFMGALLGKNKKVEIAFPGGCDFGERKIDLHFKGFESLGAKIETKDNYFLITAEKLSGAEIYLDFASVGATINIMLASVKADGVTIINNAAKEPEIVNVATFLNNMGAKITGAGTSCIKIIGVKKLHHAIIEVIPDRIEAGTYLILGALLGKNFIVDNLIEEHLKALLSKLKDMGVNILRVKNGLEVNCKPSYKPINIKTLPYPGFPTDLAQPMTALLTQCWGTSFIEETIYASRMGHVSELNKMNAKIKINGSTTIITGQTKLNGANIKATDLRAGASLILAALDASGKTVLKNAEYILRGYSDIVLKLQGVGADIEIIEEA